MTQFDLRLEAVGKSDRGVKRTNNEDAFAIHLPSNERPDALFMVADGIGGLSKGEVASRMTLETILKHYFTAGPGPDASGKLDPGAHLLGALQVANQEVLSKAMEEMDRMGSTVAGILIDFRRQATVFNVGDSRVYRIRNGAIAQLSQDQVLDIPVAPSEKGGTHKRTSKLLFFIGQNRPLEPYFERFTVQPGDSFVLCSDGLWSLVKSQEILELVGSQSAQTAADHLIELARQRGAPDNVTVVIIHTRELRNNSLLPLAIAGTAVVAMAAVGFVFLQNRNNAPAVNLVQTEAASTLQMSNALTATAQPSPTATGTATPIPLTPTPTASATASLTFTPTANITKSLEAVKLLVAASETSAAAITGTAAAQATTSANAQAATDAVSTISSAAIATSGAQASGTVQVKTVEAQIQTRVAGTQTALASITPSSTPTATPTASFTPSATPYVTASISPTILPVATEASIQPATNTPSAFPSAIPTTPTTAATGTSTRPPLGLGTVVSSPTATPPALSTIAAAPTNTSTPTRAMRSTANTLPDTVTLADGTVLEVDTSVTYQLFSGTRKLYKGPGSRYGEVIEIASGQAKYPVLARLENSFYWYLILLSDGQVGWVALPANDDFARIETAGQKTLGQLRQLPQPPPPTLTSTPTSVK